MNHDLLTLFPAALDGVIAVVLEAAPYGLDRAEDVAALEVHFNRVRPEESSEPIEQQRIQIAGLDGSAKNYQR